jgi:hypothetical protein
VRELGSATSALTLFQQVGGTVGLAIVGSIFGTTFLEEVPGQLTSRGVPAPLADAFASGGTQTLNQIGGVGDLGAAIAAQLPPEAQGLVPAIVSGIHQAFSLATASTFFIGVASALLAAFIVLVVMPAGRVGERVSAPDAPRKLEPEPVRVEDDRA